MSGSRQHVGLLPVVVGVSRAMMNGNIQAQQIRVEPSGLCRYLPRCSEHRSAPSPFRLIVVVFSAYQGRSVAIILWSLPES